MRPEEIRRRNPEGGRRIEGASPARLDPKLLIREHFGFANRLTRFGTLVDWQRA
jgi:hypothetical protein